MKLILDIDNMPRGKCIEELKHEFKIRRLTTMQFCRKHGFIDIYVQLSAWMKGQKANQKHFQSFIKALRKEGIVTGVVIKEMGKNTAVRM